MCLHGWETAVAFGLPLPETDAEAVGAFLRAHTDVPSSLMWRAIRAGVTYSEVATLVATSGEAGASMVIDGLLALTD